MQIVSHAKLGEAFKGFNNMSNSKKRCTVLFSEKKKSPVFMLKNLYQKF